MFEPYDVLLLKMLLCRHISRILFKIFGTTDLTLKQKHLIFTKDMAIALIHVPGWYRLKFN
jgi:hypothetical protein